MRVCCPVLVSMIGRGPQIWIACAALLIGALSATGSSPKAAAGQSATAPQDMLQDGYDALTDERPELARKIFTSLLTIYPQTDAARQARAELSKLAPSGRTAERSGAVSDDGGDDRDNDADLRDNDGDEPQDDRRASPGDRNAALNRLRMRFVSDVGDRVFFAENSAALGGRALAILDAQARWLAVERGLSVTIVGRAADGGSHADAMALAQARANAVAKRLTDAGVSQNRIKIDPHGDTDPIATCTDAMCAAQNRHAEVVLRYAQDLTQTGSIAPLPRTADGH